MTRSLCCRGRGGETINRRSKDREGEKENEGRGKEKDGDAEKGEERMAIKA